MEIRVLDPAPQAVESCGSCPSSLLSQHLLGCNGGSWVNQTLAETAGTRSADSTFSQVLNVVRFLISDSPLFPAEVPRVAEV